MPCQPFPAHACRHSPCPPCQASLEERLLVERYGAEYEELMQRTKKFIPGIY